jgi:hypothetical protein
LVVLKDINQGDIDSRLAPVRQNKGELPLIAGGKNHPEYTTFEGML